LAPVRIRIAPARPGFVHPLGRREIREVLAFVGPIASYGLRSIELRHAVGDEGSPLTLASLRVPGVVLLVEQPEQPWLIRGSLTAATRRRLERAGAQVVEVEPITRVEWPGDTLADFMRFDGLLHEIGHHLVQHHTGKRTARVLRTADHERRAQRFADACRRAWAGGGGPS
jgi:hypothetical protein